MTVYIKIQKWYIEKYVAGLRQRKFICTQLEHKQNNVYV